MNTNNIYKDNLSILINLKHDESLYYENNSILLDDRILSNYRYGNNIEKIVEIIKISFLHYYNLALIIPGGKQVIVKLLEDSIEGLRKFINNKCGEEICINLLKELEKLMTELPIDDSKSEEKKKYKKTSFKFFFTNLNNKYTIIQRLRIKIANLLTNFISYFF